MLIKIARILIGVIVGAVVGGLLSPAWKLIIGDDLPSVAISVVTGALSGALIGSHLL